MHTPHTHMAGTSRAHTSHAEQPWSQHPPPTHHWVRVFLCHQVPLGRLLLGRRQRYLVLLHLTSHPPPTFLAPFPPCPPAPSDVRHSPREGCAAGPHLGKQRCPAPQADQGQQEAQAQHEQGQQGGAGLLSALPPRLEHLDPTGGHGAGAVPASPAPHPWTLGMGGGGAGGRIWPGRGRGQGNGAGAGGGWVGDEDRKPDTVIKLRAWPSAVHGAGHAPLGLQSPERVPAGGTHLRPRKSVAMCVCECAAGAGVCG